MIKKEKKKILILDTSTLFYRAAFSKLDEVNTFKSLEPVYEYISDVIRDLKLNVGGLSGVDKIISVMDSTSILLRQQIYPDYKKTRREDISKEKEFVRENRFNLARHISKYGIQHIMKNGYESDDIIYTLAQKLKKDYDVWIYTVDKDLMQMVEKNVSIITWNAKGYTLVEHDDLTYLYDRFMLNSYSDIFTHLVYVGDSSDSIEGVAGVGKKTISLLIDEFGDVDGIFRNADKIKDMKIRNSEKISLNISNSYDIIERNKKLIKLMEVPDITGLLL
jgi:DNA-directed DNA polymerase